MTSSLLLSGSSRLVSREELGTIAAPPATPTWFPVRHADVLETVSHTLQDAGFRIAASRLGLTRNDARFFGTLDLESVVADGIHLCVGVRNSTDKSFPLALCCGERVLVCDNLSFSSEIVITRKHTKHAAQRFREGIVGAMLSLRQYQQAAGERIHRLRNCSLSTDQANSLILQAYEAHVLSPRLLPKVLAEYRAPRHPEFAPRTAWSLLNAFTEVLKERLTQPAQHASLTMQLQGLLGSAVSVVPAL